MVHLHLSQELHQPPHKQASRRRRSHSLRTLFLTPAPLSTINPSPTTALPPPSSCTPQPNPTIQPPVSMRKPTSTASEAGSKWYVDDLSTRKAYSRDPFLLGKLRFELPPHPSKPAWQDRCFCCLVRGHDASDCQAPVRACARCLKPGHGYSSCPRLSRHANRRPTKPSSSFSVLSPQGTINKAALPRDRPSSIDIFLPLSADGIEDLRYLNKGVVIDARLRPGEFCPARIQAAVLTFVDTAAPFPLVHMAGERFLLLLEDAADRPAFIASIKPKMETVGLVTYPWSPAIDATPVGYRYKLWVDLHNVPIDAWNLRHLLPLVGQFGMLLEHAPFTEVSNIEKLRVLVAVQSLSDVPRAARLTVKGLRHQIPLQVVAGLEDRLDMLHPPPDPTPSYSYFKDLERKLQDNPPPSRGFNRQQKKVAAVSLEFEVAFEAWKALPPSQQKDALARKLQDSPYWSISKAQAHLDQLPLPPLHLPSPSPFPEHPVSAKQTVPTIVIHAGSKGKGIATDNLALLLEDSQQASLSSPQPLAVASCPARPAKRVTVTSPNDSHTVRHTVLAAPDPTPKRISLERCQSRRVLSPSRPLSSPHVPSVRAHLTASVQNSSDAETRVAASASFSQPLQWLTQQLASSPKPRAVVPSSLLVGPTTDPSAGPSSLTAGPIVNSPKRPTQCGLSKAPSHSFLVGPTQPIGPSLSHTGPQTPTSPLAVIAHARQSNNLRRSSRKAKPARSLQGFHVGVNKRSRSGPAPASIKAVQAAITEASLNRSVIPDTAVPPELSSEERTALSSDCGLLIPLPHTASTPPSASRPAAGPPAQP